MDRSLSVAISILTFNRAPLLKELLSSLQGPAMRDVELIVVDNHSGDETPRIMSEEFPGVTYLRTTANIGVAARNMGIQRSQADIVVTLDDDISGITSDDIAYLVGQFENHHKLGAMNFKVVDHATGSLSNWVHHRNQDEWAGRRFTTYEITEGAVAFRRMVFEKSGYYPEHFFLSHEGPDLAFRIMERATTSIPPWSRCFTAIQGSVGKLGSTIITTHETFSGSRHATSPFRILPAIWQGGLFRCLHIRSGTDISVPG